MDWLDLLAAQGTLKSLLQHHSSKASILQRSGLFTVQLSHPYMTTGKTIALTRETFRFLLFPFFEVYYGEEIPFIQGKEQQLCFAGAAMKRYHTSTVRKPSKMVGVARGHERADTILKPYSQKTSQSNHTRTTALSNSMKLSHPHGVTQDGRVLVERSDRMRSTGEGNGKPLQYSCFENPKYSMKSQNNRILNEELPRSVGAQYATGDQWRNNSRRMKGWSQSKNNTQLWM